jgi:hypothetical protein
MALRFWFCASITTISALVSAGFSVVGLLGPSGSDIFARYAASRSIAMLVAALSCMALRWRKGVAAMALAMSLVQGPDEDLWPLCFCRCECCGACLAFEHPSDP